MFAMPNLISALVATIWLALAGYVLFALGRAMFRAWMDSRSETPKATPAAAAGPGIRRAAA